MLSRAVDTHIVFVTDTIARHRNLTKKKKKNNRK